MLNLLIAVSTRSCWECHLRFSMTLLPDSIRPDPAEARNLYKVTYRAFTEIYEIIFCVSKSLTAYGRRVPFILYYWLDYFLITIIEIELIQSRISLSQMNLIASSVEISMVSK